MLRPVRCKGLPKTFKNFCQDFLLLKKLVIFTIINTRTMQTPPIKLIPAEYLLEVKGNVMTREILARKHNLPKVVLDRLVCDRSRRVREAVASNPGLDAEQVAHLLDENDYEVMYCVNRNYHLSHELVAMQIRHRWGVRDKAIFCNPNIKPSEFVELLRVYMLENRVTWDRRTTIQSATRNKGVGNGAIIAFTEMVFEIEPRQYDVAVSCAMSNPSISARSVEYIFEKAKRRLANNNASLINVMAAAVGNDSARDSFIDSVVMEYAKIGDPRSPLSELDFRPGYVASDETLEIVASSCQYDRDERLLSFMINHVPADRLTQARLTDIGFTEHSTTAMSALFKIPDLHETTRERLIEVVIRGGQEEEITKINVAGYIQTHHTDEMAKSSSWVVRRNAARLPNISEAALKRLARDNDSDVRQAVYENPKWELVKDSVEAQQKAVKLAATVRDARVVLNRIPKDQLCEHAEEYPSLKDIFDAIALLQDERVYTVMTAFANEESRNLMKDGIDTDTLSILQHFF